MFLIKEGKFPRSLHMHNLVNKQRVDLHNDPTNLQYTILINEVLWVIWKHHLGTSTLF